MAHQTVNLIHGDDARLFVDQAVAADGAQDLGIGDGEHDRVFAHLVEGKNARRDPASASPRQVDVGLPIQEFRPRPAATAQ
jgi:hypothetical protein